jgi:nitrate reductase gamma subunit
LGGGFFRAVHPAFMSPESHPVSESLKLLENEVQVAALLFMGVVYVFRFIWIFRFQSQRERTYPAGSEASGIGYSLMNIAMPWAMESTRKNPAFYAQFVVFHLGVIAAIAATFIIPYAPGLLEVKAVVRLFQTILSAACLAGVLRFIRRLRNPAIRLISTADDYFSLLLMIVFFAAGVLAVPNDYRRAEWPLVIFFGLTAFFLIYVPFSKICHYLYYPFTRFFLGRTLGHRGALPPQEKAGDRPLPRAAGEGRA